jgi:hypothetical protein
VRPRPSISGGAARSCRRERRSGLAGLRRAVLGLARVLLHDVAEGVVDPGEELRGDIHARGLHVLVHLLGTRGADDRGRHVSKRASQIPTAVCEVSGPSTRRRAQTAPSRPSCLAYVRVSTTAQADHGASHAAQRATLIAEGARRGWTVEVVADEGLSGKNLKRPGLQDALRRLDRGEASYLMAVRLDRVSRSVADFAGLIDRSTRKGGGSSSSTTGWTPRTPQAGSPRTCSRQRHSTSGS